MFLIQAIIDGMASVFYENALYLDNYADWTIDDFRPVFQLLDFIGNAPPGYICKQDFIDLGYSIMSEM